MKRLGISRNSMVRWMATAAINACLCLCAGAAGAQTASSNYALVVASGFLCEPNGSSSCAATAKADPGDSYEISGAGIFDAKAKSAQAAGTFAHKSTNGHVLESGVWLVSDLVGFDSYGAEPGALPQDMIAFRSTLFGAKRFPIQLAAVPTGGLAVFRIRLLSISGVSKTAVLEVNCALGNVPNERSVEGIRLIFDRNGGAFFEAAGGRVMILSVRPGPGVPNKAPQQ